MRALTFAVLLILVDPAFAQKDQSLWPSPQTKPNALTIGPVPTPPDPEKLEAYRKSGILGDIVKQFRACLNPGIKDRRRVTVELDLYYYSDGSLMREPTLIGALPADPEDAKTIRLIVDSIRSCRLKLPADSYEIWKFLPVTFESRTD